LLIPILLWKKIN